MIRRQLRGFGHPVFFSHIPKTGGTTLRFWAWSQYRRRQVFPHRDDFVGGAAYPPLHDLIAAIDAGADRFRLIYGHYPLVAAGALRRPARLVTMFREPMARAVSHLGHHIRRDVRRRHGRIAAETTPITSADAAAYLTENRSLEAIELNNPQTWLIGPRSLDQHAGWHDGLSRSARLDLALEGLDRLEVFGLLEAFDQSVRLFAKILGWSGRPGRARNVAPAPLHLEPDLLARLEHCLELDRVLYERAWAAFDSLTRRHLGEPARLDPKPGGAAR